MTARFSFRSYTAPTALSRSDPHDAQFLPQRAGTGLHDSNLDVSQTFLLRPGCRVVAHNVLLMQLAQYSSRQLAQIIVPPRRHPYEASAAGAGQPVQHVVVDAVPRAFAFAWS